VLKVNSMFSGANARASKLPGLIREMTARNDCLFFDASQVVTPSKEDGVHLDAENNIKLGRALAEFIKSMA
jgi:lysophospholipase L1-like esterase